MRACILLAVLLAASGCAAIKPSDTTLRETGWADRGDRREVQPAAVWCYRTIGRPDCSHVRLPGQEYRLIHEGANPPRPAPMVMDSDAARRARHEARDPDGWPDPEDG